MIRKDQYEKTSRFISYLLRHHPEEYNLKMDEHGWVKTDELVEIVKSKKNSRFEKRDLICIVNQDSKMRYSFDDDVTKQYIRANQGHSIDVDLELVPIKPPTYLFHGTGIKSLDSIEKEGITKQSRQYVHLSVDVETSENVGKRHGAAVIIKIDAKQMYLDGYKFYLSENKVWLTDFVPPKYIINSNFKGCM